MRGDDEGREAEQQAQQALGGTGDTLNPGDQAPAGTPATGENLCRECGGTGRLEGGAACPACGGTGRVVEGVSAGA